MRRNSGDMNKRKKILFFIHDLGHGGAEKVLVNLVNNLDKNKFDITVLALFGGGVNEGFLKEDIKYKTIFKKTFRGNSNIMKLFSPRFLHQRFVKEKYDIEVSYLEGPCARIISGCPYDDVKLVSWIHSEHHTKKNAAKKFRSYEESVKCYQKFDKTICVSEYVMQTVFSIGMILTVPLLPETMNCLLPQPFTSTEDTKIRANALSYSKTARLLSATSTPSSCDVFKKDTTFCGSPKIYTIKSTR